MSKIAFLAAAILAYAQLLSPAMAIDGPTGIAISDEMLSPAE